jgi:hypothetical protein
MAYKNFFTELPYFYVDVKRSMRAKFQSTNPTMTKASCPAASASTDELSKGEITPATKADNIVMVKD